MPRPFAGLSLLALLASLLLVSACAEKMAGAPSANPATIAQNPELPFYIGNGAGSRLGNYGARMDGEMRGPDGQRCVIFNWDRPLTPQLALRLRSASCESQERPGLMVATELERIVIPLSASNLASENDQPQ